MAERITPYSFLSDGWRAGALTYGANLVTGANRIIMRYYQYCDALYHKRLGKLSGRTDLLELGDAEYLCRRITSAIAREPATIKVGGTDTGKADRVAAFVKNVLARNIWGAKEAEAELYASRKGRGVFRLDYSPAKNRLILSSPDPAEVWPVVNEYGDLTGYRVVQESDKPDPKSEITGDEQPKLIRVDEFREVKGRTLKTAGYQRAVEKEGATVYQWVEWDAAPDGGKVRDLDIGITFLPIVHFNNLPGPEEQPISDMHPVFNVLEKMAVTDGDTGSTSKTLASPPLVIEGPQPTSMTKAKAAKATQSGTQKGSSFKVAPSQVVFTGEPGRKAYILDVSNLLTALKTHDSMLHDRLYTNSAVTRIGAGAMEGKDWPAWESLALASGPLIDLVAMKLATRDEKYSLLGQFIARYGVAKGLIGDLTEADVKAMTFTVTFPQALQSNVRADRQFAIDAYQARVIDLQTALEFVKSTGIDIDVQTVIGRMDRVENFLPPDAAARGDGDGGV